MQKVIELLAANSILLLFIVAGVGYQLGRIKIGGARLGISAVLFFGLILGSLDESLRLPDIIYQFGLVLFVYCMGLSSSSMFFQTIIHKGLRNNLLVVAGLLLAAAAGALFGFNGRFTAGLFCGSLNNTPSLASVLEQIRLMVPAGAGLESKLVEPVVAYSLAYPMGVLGMILAIYICQKIWKIDYAREVHSISDVQISSEALLNKTVLVRSDFAQTVSDFITRHHCNVIFGRLKRGEILELVYGSTVFQPGDLVNVIGPEAEVERTVNLLGEESQHHLEFDVSVFDRRRIFVSNPDLLGKRLKDIGLFDKFGAVVTRSRRGDIEFSPHGGTLLLPGDQLMIVARRTRIAEIIKLFGDSYREISEINIMTFSLGLVLGFLLGMLPIPLPGGLVFRLGIAGGPLVVGLVLGAIGRSGPFSWHVPYAVNLSLKQLGLVLFLAGIGTKAGYAFFNTLGSAEGLTLFLSGMVITISASFFLLFVGYRLLKIPFGMLTGVISGFQTQPAVLAFALDQSENELPNVGYAMVYPVVTVVKILLAQLLLML